MDFCASVYLKLQWIMRCVGLAMMDCLVEADV